MTRKKEKRTTSTRWSERMKVAPLLLSSSRSSRSIRSGSSFATKKNYFPNLSPWLKFISLTMCPPILILPLQQSEATATHRSLSFVASDPNYRWFRSLISPYFIQLWSEPFIRRLFFFFVPEVKRQRRRWSCSIYQCTATRERMGLMRWRRWSGPMNARLAISRNS